MTARGGTTGKGPVGTSGVKGVKRRKSLGPPPTIEYIDRLVREFNAELAIRISSPLPADAARLRTSRRRVQAKLYTQFPGDDIQPYEWAEKEPYLTVVWDRHLLPSDSARALIRRLLIGVGMWDSHVNHLWTVPRDVKGPIQPTEMARFRPWLMEALAATGCQPVLLIGRALWVWRPDLRLSTTHGRIGVMRSRWVVMPLEAPERLGKAELGDWNRHLVRFMDRVHDGHFLDYLPTTCVKCDERVYWYDSDAVPWCREHTEEGLKQQERGVKKWGTLEIAGGQTRFPGFDGT